MKITASKRDEILKRKAEYDEKYEKYKARKDELDERYHEAVWNITENVKSNILQLLKGYDALKFNVEVRRGWYASNKDKSVYVRIRCDSGALKWEYEARLDREGKLELATNSWSGLNATTAEELESLRQTLGALYDLEKVDWESVIRRPDLPEYSDYVDPDNIRPESENFDAQLEEATLEELIGTDTIVKVWNWDGSGFWGKYVWVKLVGQTASFWKVHAVGSSYVEDPRYYDRIKTDFETYRPIRVKKSNLNIVDPIETKEL